MVQCFVDKNSAPVQLFLKRGQEVFTDVAHTKTSVLKMAEYQSIEKQFQAFSWQISMNCENAVDLDCYILQSIPNLSFERKSVIKNDG